MSYYALGVILFFNSFILPLCTEGELLMRRQFLQIDLSLFGVLVYCHENIQFYTLFEFQGEQFRMYISIHPYNMRLYMM